MRIIFLFLIFFISACDEKAEPPPPKEEQTTEIEEVKPQLILTATEFSTLPDWGSDDFNGFDQAFMRSCDKIKNRDADQQFGVLKQAGTYGNWQRLCMDISAIPTTEYQKFFEEHFTPYQVSADKETVGLFTGYYEASLNGSRTKSERYNIPLHKRPDDLVMVQLGDFRENLKGTRIAGRVVGGNLKPYEQREDIINGNWPHNDHVLLWVDNAVDAFFVQIQGSGLVQMEDGSLMRIGYAGQNGHIYYAIGRELIKRGHLTKEHVSMQSIRHWLENNPDQADDIMNTNASYVFFREIKGDGPIGAQGTALTAMRSLAVDRTLISYGLPLWVDIEPPPVKDITPGIQRMMIAQDTGGAITGPVRGDVFWGYGDYAARMAGQMASDGRYWILLPKEKIN